MMHCQRIGQRIDVVKFLQQMVNIKRQTLIVLNFKLMK